LDLLDRIRRRADSRGPHNPPDYRRDQCVCHVHSNSFD
jgi:hypothetical protein